MLAKLVKLGPFVILGMMALYLRRHWSEIPDRFPIHWGVDGQANGWSTRSTGGVYFPLILGAAICLLLLVINLSMAGVRASRLTAAEVERERRVRGVVVGMLTAIEYFIAGLFAWVAFIPLRREPNVQPPVAAIVLPLFLLIGISMVMLIRAARRPHAAGGGPHGVTAGDDPSRNPDYWYAGVFYANPDDPALMVEKRFGIGYTFNFGNPRSWIAAGVLVVLIIGATLLPFLLK